jgi:hypothetical protein
MWQALERKAHDPAVHRWLHCGSGVTLSCHPVTRCNPAVHQRAPLRQRAVVGGLGLLIESSRQSSAGSIAAGSLPGRSA